MRKFRLFAEGYIDKESEFEYKHINNHREVFPLIHDHDYFEFFLIIEGTIEHFVNNQKNILERGHLVFIRPSDFHSYKRMENQNCHFVNLAILGNTIDDLFHYLGSGIDKEQLISSKYPPVILLTNSELQSLISKLEKLNTLPVLDKKRLNLELRVLLIYLFTNYFVRRSDQNNHIPEWLSLTITELKKPENFRTGLDSIKKIACKSDEHISRSFKKYLQKTPTQYINELKLNFAANQIRFSNRKIADIAFDAGFENLSYFYRQFMQLFGYTPNEFRKMNLRHYVINQNTENN